MRTLRVNKGKFVITKGELDIGVGGILVQETERLGEAIDDENIILPDLITLLQNETNLTRKTIVKILLKSGKLGDFKNNPKKFIEEVGEIIKRNMTTLLVDGIKYTKVGEDEFYAKSYSQRKSLVGIYIKTS